MEFQKKKQMYISAGSAIAFVGASLTGQIPPAVIFATGSALSGYNTYDSYAKYKAAMQAHLAATTFDDQVVRKKVVDAEKSETVLQGTLAVGSAALSLPLKMAFMWKLMNYLKMIGIIIKNKGKKKKHLF